MAGELRSGAGVGVRSAGRFVLDLHGAASVGLVALVSVSAIAGLVEAAGLLAFVRAVSLISGNADEPLVVLGLSIGGDAGAMLIVASLLVVAAMGGHAVVARGAAQFSERVCVRARERLIDGFGAANWPYQVALREGRLQEHAQALTNRAARASMSLVTGLSTFIVLLVIMLTALLTDPVASVLLLVAVIPVLWVLQPLVSAGRAAGRTGVRRSLAFAERIAVATSLTKEYRTLGVESVQTDELKAASASEAAAAARARLVQLLSGFLFRGAAVLALIAIVGLLYLFGDLTSPAGIASVLLVLRALGYAQLSHRAVLQALDDAPSVIALRTAIDEAESAAEPLRTQRLDRLETVRFRDVSFEYSPDRPALRSVSFLIGPDETVGLVGPSGSGKSTVAELLLGLRTPTAGRITVGQLDLIDISRRDWTRIASFVPQDAHVIEASVADNIRFHRPWITDDDVVEAARLAHVYEDIALLPDGFGTMLEPRNQGLSGGQRQRLAIARALAGRPQLLILDEPTSALDDRAEQLVGSTIEGLHGRLGIVLISHRRTLLASCDRIVELSAGVVESIQDLGRAEPPST